MRNLYRKSTENNMGTIQRTNQPTRLKTARDLGKDHSAGNGTSQKERKKERKKEKDSPNGSEISSSVFDVIILLPVIVRCSIWNIYIFLNANFFVKQMGG
jgi:beta-lactam-binding protein with PASTA domain